MANFLDSTPLSGFFYNPEDDRAAAEAGLQQGNDAFRGLQVPDYQPVSYAGPQETYDINAQNADMERVGPTAYGDIAVDPRLKSTQLAQLSALEELRNGGGMNAADRANLAKISTEESAKEQAQRAAIMQGAQARGTGGSNLALMQMLQAQQSGANRQAQRDLDVAGMAQDRALQAGSQASTLAGNMGNQEFNQQAQVAAARDAAAKFNSQMVGQTSQFNVGNQMRADIQNQNKTQGVYDKLAQAKMEQERQNKFTSPQAQFQAGATKATGLANAGRAQSEYYGNREDTAKKQQSGLWGAGLEGAMKAASMFGGSGAGNGSTSKMGGSAGQGESYNNSPAGMAGNDGISSTTGSEPVYQNYPSNYVEQRDEKEFKPYGGY
jgi:hypothetical protein